MDWKWSLMFLILSSCYHTTRSQVDHKLVKKYFIDIYNRALIKAMKEQDSLIDRSSNFAPFFQENKDHVNVKSSNFAPYVDNYEVFHEKGQKLTKGVKKKPSPGSFHSPEAHSGWRGPPPHPHHKHKHHTHHHKHTNEHKHAHQHTHEQSHEHKHKAKHKHVHKHEHHHEHNHHHKHKDDHDHGHDHKHAHKHVHSHKVGADFHRFKLILLF